MHEPTPKQLEVFQYISEFVSSNGYSPTLREIGDRFKCNVRAASDFVNALEKKRFVTRVRNRPRTLRPT